MQILINLKIKWEGSDVIVNPVDPIPEPTDPSIYKSLEDFGGNSFYKEFIDNISIEGNRLKTNGLFTEDFVGKKFCGINSNKNPNEENFDYYYPSLITSRYATVTKFISPNELEIDFTFNLDSKKGYFFFDNSEAFTKAINSGEEVIQLKKDSTYVIPEYKTNNIKNNFRVQGKNATLLIGYESYFQWAKEKKISQPDHLIYTEDDIEVVFDCNLLSPYTTVPESWPFNRDLFRNPSNNKNQVAVFGLMNSTQPLISKFGTLCKGWGFGFTYSGKDIYNVIKNVKTSTNNFLQPKSNNADGSNAMILLDSEFIQNQAEINTDRIKCEGYIDNDGVFNITSDNNVYQIYNIFMIPDQWANRGQIVHIGRFSFPIHTKNILGANRIKLDIPEEGKVYSNIHYYQGGLMAELNAGDIIEINGKQYTVISKDRSLHPYFMENNYSSLCVLNESLNEGRYDVKIIKSTAKELLNQTQPCWMIYKVNSFWKSTIDTKFGDKSILWSPTEQNAMFYPHIQVNIWAKNIILDGYYRVSSGQGMQKYCNIVNVKNISQINTGPYFGDEFGAQVPITTDMEVPEKVKHLLL